MTKPLSPEDKKAKAGLRREGREAAIQFLYQIETPGEHSALPDADFWRLRTGTPDPEDPSSPPPQPATAPKAKTFAETLVQGVLAHREEIDQCIVQFAKNYELQRIAAVDRNILRLAVYEMLHNPKVPLVVAINEAIEIAKKFGSEESGRFVNGILDQIRTHVAQPTRERDRAAETPKN